MAKNKKGGKKDHKEGNAPTASGMLHVFQETTAPRYIPRGVSLEKGEKIIEWGESEPASKTGKGEKKGDKKRRESKNFAKDVERRSWPSGVGGGEKKGLGGKSHVILISEKSMPVVKIQEGGHTTKKKQMLGGGRELHCKRFRNEKGDPNHLKPERRGPLLIWGPGKQVLGVPPKGPAKGTRDFGSG